MDVRVGLWRRLSADELMPLNCGVGEDCWESLGLHEIQLVHSEGYQPWDFFGRNDAKAETPVLWPPHAKSWLIGKDSDARRDWGQEEKGMTGWDGWMASLTWWTWVWVNSGSWWWTGRPGVLRFMGLQRVGHDWATELNWTELKGSTAPEIYYMQSTKSQTPRPLWTFSPQTRWLSGPSQIFSLFVLCSLLFTVKASSLLPHFSVIWMETILLITVK